ncbi:MAG TPA: M23 family metallopeptidase [Usitatibacteraceae bacterium]
MTFAEFKILAQKQGKGLWDAAPKRALIAIGVLFALPVFGVLTAFGVASDTQLESVPRHEVIEALALPPFTESLVDDEQFRSSERIQRGDTVATLLQRLNVNDNAAFNFLRTTPAARSIFQLRPGRTVQAVTDADGELQSLRYLYSPDQFLEVARQDETFTAQEKKLTPTVETVQRTGTIKSSLYGATDEARIPDAIANEIARIFSTDIDFHIDLRRGDRFSVIYEMLYQDGEFLRPGRVLSAEFFNRDRKFETFLFTDEEGHDAYFSADGQNRAKSFLRSPLAFSRISSGFGGRLHPIFKNWRAHTGTDFAAPRGTPVWATADGTVEYVGVKGGYGNVVEIRHAGSVSTLYGHLSGFANGVRRGTHVSQGQTIAYVGATGWATGPHLHYEFKIAGTQRDPMRIALPKADPLPPKYLAAFRASAAVQGERLTLIRDASFGQFE